MKTNGEREKFLKEINQMLAEASVTNEEIELRTGGELLESIISPQNVDFKNEDQGFERRGMSPAARKTISPQVASHRNLQQQTPTRGRLFWQHAQLYASDNAFADISDNTNIFYLYSNASKTSKNAYKL